MTPGSHSDDPRNPFVTPGISWKERGPLSNCGLAFVRDHSQTISGLLCHLSGEPRRGDADFEWPRVVGGVQCPSGPPRSLLFLIQVDLELGIASTRVVVNSPNEHDPTTHRGRLASTGRGTYDVACRGCISTALPKMQHFNWQHPVRTRGLTATFSD